MAAHIKQKNQSLNGGLPDELLLDILSRLPVKTLKRFMCVSKSWLSTLRDPVFTRTHYLRNAAIASNRNILVKTVSESYRYDVPHTERYFLLSSQDDLRERLPIFSSSLIEHEDCGRHLNLNMIGECEGLAFVYHPNDLASCVLLNPSTRQFKALPQSGVHRPSSTDRIVTKAVGLGYDCKTDDYKVVRLVTNYYSDVDEGNRAGVDQVELYSLRSNSWREIHFNLNEEKRQSLVTTCCSAYLNGFYHWWSDIGKEILYFDMVQKNFQTVVFPIEFSISRPWIPELTIFGQFVAVIIRTTTYVDECYFDIYVMKEHRIKESWTKQLTVGPIPKCGKLLGSWRGGDQWIFRTCDAYMKLYDTNSNVVSYLPIHHFSALAFVIFTDNMLSLN